MRFRHRDGSLVHLSYCTNVHPAEDLRGVLAQLDTYADPIRRRLDADVLGLGLWLAAPVAAGLAGSARARRKLRAELDARGLEVVTLNAFPYQSFHAPVVKHAVYRPDWTTEERLRYTLDCAEVLVDLLPDDAYRGSVSSLPLAWREPWGPVPAESAARMLSRLGTGLAEIAWRTGRAVRVGLEPEPGCVLETTEQTIAALSTADTDRVGICLDLAHLACAWEDPGAALAGLAAAGVPVVKCQVSAALEAADPLAASSALREYAEPRFLHQVRPATGPHADDLAAALDGDLPGGPMRVHYHVPLHAAPVAPLAATTPVLREALRLLYSGRAAGCDHLDVETYTWEVLPVEARPTGPEQLADGIAAELAYVRDELVALGLRAATDSELAA